MQGSTLWKLVAVAVLAACSPGAASQRAEAPPASQSSTADVFRFKIGALDAVALKDGDIHVPNDGKIVGLGQSKEAVDGVLSRAGLSTETINFSIQPLLVRDDKRILLFDTGAADAGFAKAGRLPESLRSAGVEASQISDVLISHGHPDHVGGLVTKAKTLAFPNATIHISAPEWAAMKENAELAALVAVITPRVVAFQPNTVILPGVTAVAVAGHMPGHSGYQIASGGERLLFIGDTAHHSVVSVERPDWSIQFDANDDATSRASRRALLARAANENLRLYAGHFPFPGVGHVRARGDGYVWEPETTASR